MKIKELIKESISQEKQNQLEQMNEASEYASIFDVLKKEYVFDLKGTGSRDRIGFKIEDRGGQVMVQLFNPNRGGIYIPFDAYDEAVRKKTFDSIASAFEQLEKEINVANKKASANFEAWMKKKKEKKNEN